MKTSVEPLEGNKVKVSVEVEEPEFEKAVNAAFKKLAREVRIPGFRPGKAPRKVLEARLGPEVGRSQALHDSVPEYYSQAVEEHDVDVIAPPDIEITAGEDDGPVAFEAVVEVRPVVEVPGYGSLRVTIEAPHPTEDEVDAGLERLRNQFGDLEAVDRPAAPGDFVTLSVSAAQAGDEVDELTADDVLYEIGSGRILREVDDVLPGARAGDIVEVAAADPRDDDAAPIDLRILVKEVKHRVLPDLDDEFANEASEFETLDDLRNDLRRRLADVKRTQARAELREKTGAALADLVEEEMPDPLVTSEMQHRLQDLAMRLEAQGITLDQWVAISGKEPDAFVEELREAAVQAVKIDLALRAVAEAEAIEVTDDDITEEFARLAGRLQLKLAEVRKQFERAGQVPAVRSDIKKRKAFEIVLERVEIVDPEGTPIERADIEPEPEPEPEPENDGGDETRVDDARGGSDAGEGAGEQPAAEHDDEDKDDDE